MRWHADVLSAVSGLVGGPVTPLLVLVRGEVSGEGIGVIVAENPAPLSEDNFVKVPGFAIVAELAQFRRIVAGWGQSAG